MPNIATNGDDFLYTTSDGQTIDGLGGRDQIESSHNFARLLGNAGDDWLLTNYELPDYEWEDDTDIATFQSGGAGDDQLDVVLTFGLPTVDGEIDVGISSDMRAEMSGGDGHDMLSLDMLSIQADMSAVLSGGAGADRIIAKATNLGLADYGARSHDLSASGGAGDDVIRLGSDTGGTRFINFDATLSATGGAGDDTLVASSFASMTGDPNVTIRLEGGGGADVLRSSAELRTEYSPIADVRLIGGGGGDRLYAQTGAYGDSPDAVNRLEGGSGADYLSAVMVLFDPSYFSQSGVAENRLVGGSGNDILRAEVVESLADGLDRSLLNGGSGADQLRVIGGDGNQLRGGAGADRSWGGDGQDYFEFVAISDSTASARDAIMNFGAEDRIDVSRIDAGGGPGDQAFTYGGAGQTGAGYLWVRESGDDAIVTAETVSGQRLVIRVADAADFGWSEDSFVL